MKKRLSQAALGAVSFDDVIAKLLDRYAATPGQHLQGN
ncbi:hypothetical protein J2T20_002500 [Paenibacillus wynnii]|nr:hypothetical protein [Paenibacillus wynnii]